MTPRARGEGPPAANGPGPVPASFPVCCCCCCCCISECPGGSSSPLHAAACKGLRRSARFQPWCKVNSGLISGVGDVQDLDAMSDTDSDAEFEELTRQLTAAQRRERDANAQVQRVACVQCCGSKLQWPAPSRHLGSPVPWPACAPGVWPTEHLLSSVADPVVRWCGLGECIAAWCTRWRASSSRWRSLRRSCPSPPSRSQSCAAR